MSAPARRPRDAEAARRRRDPEGARAGILAAALEEFAAHGHAGARIDRIAAASGLSKPMLYAYFGDKDALYAAALREAYVQIRGGETALRLDELDPEAAVRALVSFTMRHFRENPWFVAMLNEENRRGGATVRAIADARAIQSRLIEQLGAVLERGAASGLFRAPVDPTDLYLTIASLCWFPVSNRHTVRAVFGRDIDDDAWREARIAQAADMILRWLRRAP